MSDGEQPLHQQKILAIFQAIAFRLEAIALRARVEAIALRMAAGPYHRVLSSPHVPALCHRPLARRKPKVPTSSSREPMDRV